MNEYKILETGKEIYKVYNNGKIIKCSRDGARGYKTKERILKPHKNKNGYLRVRMGLNGVYKEYFVHRIVALLFCENPNNYNIVDHIDGNKTNNYYKNLEWVTSKENNCRAYKKGLKKPTVIFGEDNFNSKFKNEDIIWIRRNYIKGSRVYGQCALARKFKVSQATIWSIINNKTWKNCL